MTGHPCASTRAPGMNALKLGVPIRMTGAFDSSYDSPAGSSPALAQLIKPTDARCDGPVAAHLKELFSDLERFLVVRSTAAMVLLSREGRWRRTQWISGNGSHGPGMADWTR